MNIKIVHSPRPHRHAGDIALHYWGAGPSHWRHPAAVLGGGYEPLAPEHFGCESAGPWTGERAFTLARSLCSSSPHLASAFGGSARPLSATPTEQRRPRVWPPSSRISNAQTHVGPRAS